MNERLFALLQYPLPHHFLSRLMWLLTRLQMGALTHWMIATFVRYFRVNMDEAADSNVSAYASFNQFFTRALKPGVRAIASGAGQLACPVDGAVSQAGAIDGNRVFQAKGHDYTLEALLGGDTALAAEFSNGTFATIYLSPRDYHRIHMPDTGRLRRMLFVPGRLFSVNSATARQVPGLFARNERLVCIFDTTHGPMAVILVGALFVGSMETVWDGPTSQTSWQTPNRSPAFPDVKHADFQKTETSITLERGMEMGRFNMGSTVILLFGKNAMQLDSALRENQPVKLGQLLGEWASAYP